MNKTKFFLALFTKLPGGTPLAILLVMFLHPEVVPRHSKVRLTLQKPFIKLIPK